MRINHQQLAVLVLAALLCGSAMAGTGGNAEFGPVYLMIQGWFQGTLGKIIALTAMGVGLTAGVVRQNIMAVVTGVGMGLGTYYGPSIVDQLVVATLPMV
ncbi:MAG: pili assembly chaperone [Rhodocyclaceae bacterium]|nr:MAG: pili assembly chaperone [Rhodocyclaceae bacterium]